MLVLRRTEGQWIEIQHKSGDVLRFRCYDFSIRGKGRIHLAFEADKTEFMILRPEKHKNGDSSD